MSYWWEVRCYDADSHLVRVPTPTTTATLHGDPQIAVDPTYLPPPTLTPTATVTVPATCAGRRANDVSVIFWVTYGERRGARNDFLTVVAPSELPGPTLPNPASLAVVTLWRVVQPVERRAFYLSERLVALLGRVRIW